MKEDIDQLIRMAQVLKVRARNLSEEYAAKTGKKSGAAEKADWASKLAEDAEQSLIAAQRLANNPAQP